MKSHIRKQSLSKLLSCYDLRIFSIHHGSLWAPKSHFADHGKSDSKLLPENSPVLLCEEFTDHKKVSQKASFIFRTDDISIISVVLNVIQRSPSQVPQKQ